LNAALRLGDHIVGDLDNPMIHGTVSGDLLQGFALAPSLRSKIAAGVMSTIRGVCLSRFLADFQRDYERIEVGVSDGGRRDVRAAQSFAWPN
jgi:hypothetical protein